MPFDVDVDVSNIERTMGDYGPKLKFDVEGSKQQKIQFEEQLDNCEWNGETYHRNMSGDRWEIDRTPTALDAIERETGVEIPRSALVPDGETAAFKIDKGSMYIELADVDPGIKKILEEELSYETSYYDRDRHEEITYQEDMIFSEGIPVGLETQLREVMEGIDCEYGIADYREEPDLWTVDFEWNFPHELRDYQKRGVARMMQGSCVVQWPTGAGKTVGALRLIHEMGVPTLILVHQNELLDQWVSEVEEILGEKPGVVQQDREEYKNITVAMVPTLHNRIEERGEAFRIDDFDMMVTDECVHPDSKITMGDGEQKKIKNIEAGEEVLTQNQNNNQFYKKEVQKVHQNENNKDWYRIESVVNGQKQELRVTEDHEIWTDSGWTQAKNLTEEHIVKLWTDSMEYSCEECEFSSTTASGIAGHSNLHSDAEWEPTFDGDYECETCGTEFATPNALGGHVLMKHKWDSEKHSEMREVRWEKMSEERRQEWVHENIISERGEDWEESMREMGKDRMGEDNPLFYNMTREEASENQSQIVKDWWESMSQEERNRRVKTWVEAPKHATDSDPTSLEKWIIDLGISGLNFVGDRQFWVEDSDGPMNPDFKVEDENKVVEVGDTNHWHDEEDISRRIERLESIGYECLYIRDWEIEEDPEQVERRIEKFVNNHDVEITNIEKIDCEVEYSYDLTVTDNHNYFANRFLVHNCHHLKAESWLDVALKTDAYYRFGLSATMSEELQKEDGHFLKIIAGIGPNDVKITPEELIDQGFLARPEFEWLYPKKFSGDFDNWQEAYKKGIVQNQDRNGIIAERAQDAVDNDKRVLVDVTRIEHGERIMGILDSGLFRGEMDPNNTDLDYDFDPDSCRDWPIPVVHDGDKVWGAGIDGTEVNALERAAEAHPNPIIWLSGEDGGEIRERSMDLFREGHIAGMVSTLLREGVDIPELDTVILAGGGKSAIQLIQTVGRSLRPQGGETATIVDCKDMGPYIQNHAKERYLAMSDYYGRYCSERPAGW